MIETIQDAAVALQAQGLFLSFNNPSSLLIGGSLADAGDGIQMFKDACALIGKFGHWTAIFPAKGLCTYEFPGALPELVSVISRVYDQYRRSGVPFKDAFREVVSDPDQYMMGRAPAHV